MAHLCRVLARECHHGSGAGSGSGAAVLRRAVLIIGAGVKANSACCNPAHSCREVVIK